MMMACRDLAGAGAGDQNFARNHRMSAVELQARKLRLCQEIWQRQVGAHKCTANVRPPLQQH